jgi:excisionase family DNA binding protein
MLTTPALLAYHTPMAHDQPNQPPQPDPLTVGELLSLQEAAEYAGLTRDSLQGYIRRGRLRAKKLGSQWVTTHAAVDQYLQSRDINSIPKKYRNRS